MYKKFMRCLNLILITLIIFVFPITNAQQNQSLPNASSSSKIQSLKQFVKECAFVFKFLFFPVKVAPISSEEYTHLTTWINTHTDDDPFIPEILEQDISEDSMAIYLMLSELDPNLRKILFDRDPNGLYDVQAKLKKLGINKNIQNIPPIFLAIKKFYDGSYSEPYQALEEAIRSATTFSKESQIVFKRDFERQLLIFKIYRHLTYRYTREYQIKIAKNLIMLPNGTIYPITGRKFFTRVYIVEVPENKVWYINLKPNDPALVEKEGFFTPDGYYIFTSKTLYEKAMESSKNGVVTVKLEPSLPYEEGVGYYSLTHLQVMELLRYESVQSFLQNLLLVDKPLEDIYEKASISPYTFTESIYNHVLFNKKQKQ